MYIIAISQSTKFLLTSCIPYIELNRSSVGMEHKRMDLNTQGSYILLLKFTSQMMLHECSFSSTTITNQNKFELNLGFSLGSHRDVTRLASRRPHGLRGTGERRTLCPEDSLNRLLMVASGHCLDPPTPAPAPAPRPPPRPRYLPEASPRPSD